MRSRAAIVLPLVIASIVSGVWLRTKIEYISSWCLLSHVLPCLSVPKGYNNPYHCSIERGCLASSKMLVLSVRWMGYVSFSPQTFYRLVELRSLTTNIRNCHFRKSEYVSTLWFFWSLVTWQCQSRVPFFFKFLCIYFQSFLVSYKICKPFVELYIYIGLFTPEVVAILGSSRIRIFRIIALLHNFPILEGSSPEFFRISKYLSSLVLVVRLFDSRQWSALWKKIRRFTFLVTPPTEINTQRVQDENEEFSFNYKQNIWRGWDFFVVYILTYH